MRDSVLRVENLAKCYGRVEAIRDVSFSVRKNAITSFLGENGAGKTTTIKVILGFLIADGGRVDLGAERVGYVPEHPVFFPWLRGWEILSSTARLFKVSDGVGGFERRVSEISERMGFAIELLERKVQTYSLGNHKKFSYLQNLLVSPDFLIVDEPFSSLDPLSIKSVRDLFLELKAKGKTLFLSSHLISEMEKICDDIVIIREGRIILEESVEKLKEQRGFDLETLFLSFHKK